MKSASRKGVPDPDFYKDRIVLTSLGPYVPVYFELSPGHMAVLFGTTVVSGRPDETVSQGQALDGCRFEQDTHDMIQ